MRAPAEPKPNQPPCPLFLLSFATSKQKKASEWERERGEKKKNFQVFRSDALSLEMFAAKTNYECDVSCSPAKVLLGQYENVPL